MQKFDDWNRQKQQIARKSRSKHFHEREVVWLQMGVNIGREQNGRGERFLRPVLIFKKLNREIFLGVPLTTKDKQGSHYHSFVLRGKPQTALLAQMRAFDAHRIIGMLGTASKPTFSAIKLAVIQLIE